MFAIGIIGMLFTVWGKVRKPQEDLETNQAVTKKDIDTKATILAQKEAEGKASLLAQQVEWEKAANEKRFTEFGIRLDASMALAQNHLHTVDVKVDNLISVVATMSNEITRLSTIIDERIPKK